MLQEELQERLLVLVPADSILRLSDLEAVQVQLAEQPLIAVAVGLAEDVLGTVALVRASLDQARSTEERESGARHAGRFSDRGKPVDRHALPEIEPYIFSPQDGLGVRRPEVRRRQD